MLAPEAKRDALVRPETPSTLWVRIWGIALIGVVLFLVFTNLSFSPRTWFDEGSHLHVPKTIVQHGVYADISSEGYRYYGPTVGVGPTVMLPIAVVFKLFGIELLYGRLVIVGYLFVALIAYYALAKRLHGRVVALLALTLLLASRTLNRDGIIEYSRQVLGEVPGFAFLVLGTLAWVIAVKSIHDSRQAAGDSPLTTRKGWLWPILAGLGFGLALVTKNQFALIVPPTLAGIALLDWVYYRVGNWRLRLLPPIVACGCFGLWMLAQFQFLGPGSFVENMALTRQAAGGAIFVFDRQALLRAGYYIVRPDLYGGLLILALAYAVYRARLRTVQGIAEGFIALLIGLWLAWFVGASLGWPRYAFPAVAFGALCIARMLADLLHWLWHGHTAARWAAGAVCAYVILIIATPLALSGRAVLSPDASAQQMAAFLDAHVPVDTVVETWEPELGVLTNHRYHYPPIQLLDTAVRHEWLGGPPIVYDGLADAPQYVVVGSFGAYTGIYASSGTLASDYAEEYRNGQYVLYKHR